MLSQTDSADYGEGDQDSRYPETLSLSLLVTHALDGSLSSPPH